MHTHSARLSKLTSGAHVDKGVVDQNQFIEVELIGEPLAFGLMEDPLVVVVSGRKKKKTRDMINNMLRKDTVLTCALTLTLYMSRQISRHISGLNN